MAIGYPLSGQFNQEIFCSAIHLAAKKDNATQVYAISPEIPLKFNPDLLETDRFYVLPANTSPPPKLKNPINHAARILTIKESHEFTPAHRRLWTEFLGRAGSKMNPRVAELYARTPQALANPALSLLDAYDCQGNLVSSLLLDNSPPRFTSYILGAHSRKFYIPHATDLLFLKMLALAREQSKRFIHLGLGVNEGILRFKKKWGAIPSWPFFMTQWEISSEEPVSRIFVRALCAGGSTSARQFLQNEPQQRPFAMLWQVKKNERISWLAGTAHFFLHSFEGSFRHLFRKIDTVLFESPLDSEFMAKVSKVGQSAATAKIIDNLTAAEIRSLEQIVHGPQGRLARIFGISRPPRIDVPGLLTNTRIWYAFFTLWTTYLERMGWRQSVDMEAWRIAREMGKKIIAMESFEEQLESLESLPPERALNFFRACSSWKKRARANQQAYLTGDLEKMMGSSAEFPTRTEHIISDRDQRFRERMLPWLEKGNCAVFVGTAHLVNLRSMLAEDGFEVRQKPYGILPTLHLLWRDFTRPDEKVTW